MSLNWIDSLQIVIIMRIEMMIKWCQKAIIGLFLIMVMGGSNLHAQKLEFGFGLGAVLYNGDLSPVQFSEGFSNTRLGVKYFYAVN